MVEAPKVAVPPRYGLLSAFEPLFLDDPHAWAGGVEFEFDLCTEIESFTDHCSPATGHTMSTETDLEFCQADPFIIKSSFKCSTGGRSVSDAFDITKRRLLAWESHQLEHIFWTGQTANGQVNPNLAFGNDTCDISPVTLSDGGAVSEVSAIAMLEEALTDVVPGGGIIHAPFGLAAYLSRSHLLERAGNKYFSPTGFPIVLGAGYPGSGPGNLVATAGETWIFGTGPLAIWWGELFMNPSEISEGIDRYRNDVTVFAERFYAIGFSCALYAVSVCL